MLHLNEAPGVHRVEEAETNWYLVEDGGALTVVDTGFPRSWLPSRARCAKPGTSLRRLRRSRRWCSRMVTSTMSASPLGRGANGRPRVGAGG